MKQIAQTSQSQDKSYQKLIDGIILLMDNARNDIAKKVNTTMVETYWHIVQYIVEYEQGGGTRAQHGKGIIKQLSLDLTHKFGKGFGISNLVYMRKLYTIFPIIGTLSQ